MPTTPAATQNTRGAPSEQLSSIAFYMPGLNGGGTEKIVLTLAGAFAAPGRRVDLLLDEMQGAFADMIPAGVHTHVLAKQSIARGGSQLLTHCPSDRLLFARHMLTSWRALSKLRRLPALADYLRKAAPDALVCTLDHTPFLACWARDITGALTRVYAREEVSLSAKLTGRTQSRRKRRRWRHLIALRRILYPRLDGVIAVSNGLRDDLLQRLGLPSEAVTTIYNPVISSGIDALRNMPCDHSWLKENTPPVILGVGRLKAQKGFATLIDAFARVREQIDARLVILGEGSDRKALETKISALGLQSQVSLPGWVSNPYSFMARSAVFVLSSRYEGLPTVLVEAMACGCPVVATNCPSGPDEILLGGRLGPLVPVDNVPELAGAILNTIKKPPATQELQNRAADFSVERGVTGHATLIRAGTKRLSPERPVRQ